MQHLALFAHGERFFQRRWAASLRRRTDHPPLSTKLLGGEPTLIPLKVVKVPLQHRPRFLSCSLFCCHVATLPLKAAQSKNRKCIYSN